MPATLERNATPTTTAQQPRLMDRVRECMRVAHYSLRTERAYCHWINAYIHHHDLHPRPQPRRTGDSQPAGSDRIVTIAHPKHPISLTKAKLHDLTRSPK